MKMAISINARLACLLRICFSMYIFFNGSGFAMDLPDLKEGNFDNIVNGSRFVFVLFYAPWCERSVEVLKTLERVSDEVKIGDVVIAKVNAYDEVKLSVRFWIDRWPLFKFFIKGSVTPESYRGGMMFRDFLGFIQAMSKLQTDPSIFDQAIMELDHSNFERVILNRKKNVFVLFYAKWCNSCSDLMQIFVKIGENFKNEKDCVIAKIDSDTYYDIAVLQEVPQYPSIRVYSKANKDGYVYYPGKNQENWSEQNITKFLNLQCKTKRTVSGRLDGTAGRLKDFESLVQTFMRSSFMREEILHQAISLQRKRIKGSSADVYVKIMRQVLIEGVGYLTKELSRIERLMYSAINPHKADELQRRKNILTEFAVKHHERDEL